MSKSTMPFSQLLRLTSSAICRASSTQEANLSLSRRGGSDELAILDEKNPLIVPIIVIRINSVPFYLLLVVASTLNSRADDFRDEQSFIVLLLLILDIPTFLIAYS